jgi:hypothetical protein
MIKNSALPGQEFTSESQNTGQLTLQMEITTSCEQHFEENQGIMLHRVTNHFRNRIFDTKFNRTSASSDFDENTSKYT